MKKLRFGLFENAQTNDSGTATWRHPDSKRHLFETADYWQEIARISEDACLDFMFLADAWGWADVNGSRPDVCSLEGLDLPRLDPAVVAATVIPTTKNLGLVLTGSTLLQQPYSFARRMASLDHLSGGRVGWNIVTTGTAETAAQAFGVPMVGHDERYEMAEDFMEVVYKLWESAWEPGALELDKQGRYADPAKVHRISHVGPYFRSHGYGNTSYSPQGTPVLFQAGSSPAGRRFGGRHGECIFLGGGSPAALAQHVQSVRAEAVSAGRSADAVKLMSAFSCVIGSTREEAESKYASILESQSPEVTIASYAWFTGIDLSAHDPQTPMSDLHTEMSQTQVARFGDLTVGEVLKDWHAHGVGVKPFVGTPEEAADQICSLASEADLDGFLLSPVIQPGSTLDFVEHVLPILRKRGVASSEYESASLRERLLGSDSPTLPADHPGAGYRNRQGASVA
ncbi:NtaA/DmoA family FMN-dependent monooxygenase [Paenarthrobacter sp. YIM B13468]|uniref:NtaA/DmoA family FMN-dependent monooxygenase n=1 Tax=Paenarthrobacter sp. YIM B13468 TaxID=3366295 RepID=UPI00366F147B